MVARHLELPLQGRGFAQGDEALDRGQVVVADDAGVHAAHHDRQGRPGHGHALPLDVAEEAFGVVVLGDDRPAAQEVSRRVEGDHRRVMDGGERPEGDRIFVHVREFRPAAHVQDIFGVEPRDDLGQPGRPTRKLIDRDIVGVDFERLDRRAGLGGVGRLDQAFDGMQIGSGGAARDDQVVHPLDLSRHLAPDLLFPVGRQGADRDEAGLEAAIQRDEEFRDIAQLKHDGVERLEAEAQEAGGEPVAHVVELAMGPAGVGRTDNRDPVGVANRRLVQYLPQGLVRQHTFGAIAGDRLRRMIDHTGDRISRLHLYFLPNLFIPATRPCRGPSVTPLETVPSATRQYGRRRRPGPVPRPWPEAGRDGRREISPSTCPSPG